MALSRERYRQDTDYCPYRLCQIEFDPASVPTGMVHGRVDADRSVGCDRCGCRRKQSIADRLRCGQPDRTRLSRVLLWRLNVELRHGAEFSESVEHRASRIGGVLLFVLAAYVLVNAAYSLWRREGQEFSPPGLILAVLAIPVMWWLARAKMRVAAQIGSRALRADAVESITCGYLSGVVLLGLIVQLLMPGWWWIDSVASLAIVVLLVKEGREAWEGQESDATE